VRVSEGTRIYQAGGWLKEVLWKNKNNETASFSWRFVDFEAATTAQHLGHDKDLSSGTQFPC
jgi:hypothetical protein